MSRELPESPVSAYGRIDNENGLPEVYHIISSSIDRRIVEFCYQTIGKQRFLTSDKAEQTTGKLWEITLPLIPLRSGKGDASVRDLK